MNCANPDIFSISLGDSKTMFLQAVGSQLPLDLTYCTEIVVNLPNADGTTVQLKLSLGQVLIGLVPQLGQFQVPLSSDVSMLLNTGELQSFDVTFTIATNVNTVRFFQALSVFEVV